MQRRYKKIIFSFVFALLLLLPQVSLAQKQGLQKAFGSDSPLSKVKTGAGYSDENIGDISGRVINTVLTLVGVVFLLLMVYAGYLWMTARGEDAQIKKAMDIVKGTVIGLVLVLSAYAITVFVTKGLNPASPSGGGVCVVMPDEAACAGTTACDGLNQGVCGDTDCCVWATVP